MPPLIISGIASKYFLFDLGNVWTIHEWSVYVSPRVIPKICLIDQRPWKRSHWWQDKTGQDRSRFKRTKAKVTVHERVCSFFFSASDKPKRVRLTPREHRSGHGDPFVYTLIESSSPEDPGRPDRKRSFTWPWEKCVSRSRQVLQGYCPILAGKWGGGEEKTQVTAGRPARGLPWNDSFWPNLILIFVHSLNACWKKYTNLSNHSRYVKRAFTVQTFVCLFKQYEVQFEVFDLKI